MRRTVTRTANQPLPKAAIVGMATFVVLACACSPDRAQLEGSDVLGAPLVNADAFEIVSLDPFVIDFNTARGEAIDHLYGYQVMCDAEVDDVELRREITKLVASGLAPEGGTDACFNPRHGIRAVVDGRTIEFVICYECRSLQIYEDGDFKASHPTTNEPAAALTEIWERLGCQIEP